MCYINQILKWLSSPRDGIALKCLKLTESIWDAKERNMFSSEMVGFILHRLLLLRKVIWTKKNWFSDIGFNDCENQILRGIYWLASLLGSPVCSYSHENSSCVIFHCFTFVYLLKAFLFLYLPFLVFDLKIPLFGQIIFPCPFPQISPDIEWKTQTLEVRFQLISEKYFLSSIILRLLCLWEIISNMKI